MSVHGTGTDILPVFGFDLTAFERSHSRAVRNRSLICVAGSAPGTNDLAFVGRFRHAAIVPHSQPFALLHIRFRVLSFRTAAAGGIFLAVDRRQMRRISIEIRPPDSKLLAVCIDPFPQAFSGNPSLRPCRAFDAYDIGGKPRARAAAGARALV